MDKMCASFSGGLTSGYMTEKLLIKFAGKKDILITFANTGRENEETLIFVNECDKRWRELYGVGVVWLESVTHPKHGKGQTHKVVTFETASRNGEPFEQFIAKEGIPSMGHPRCSERLKTLAMESYRKEHGYKGCTTCIGIRTDEGRRRGSPKTVKRYNLVYPLLDWFPSDKVDVNNFWEDMPFTLDLEDHEGNCQVCWKKSDKKLWLIAIESPERFDFEKRIEKEYKHVKENDGVEGLFGIHKNERRYFRGHKTCQNIIDESKNMCAETLRKIIGLDKDANSGCGESCEPYQIDIEDI
jgi:hypothetical protein